MHFSSLTSALALASGAAAFPSYGLDPRQASALNTAMVARGRSYIGTSLTIRSDTTEQNIIKSAEFGSITPENAMKWDATEPNKGSFSFGNADQIANFATQNNKQLRCHTLVWYSQLPSWVTSINNNATLISVMENHIKTLMTRYKGECTHWDVVNEGNSQRRWNLPKQRLLQSYRRSIHPHCVPRRCGSRPAAKLFYNDYNLEYGEAKHKGALRIVKLIQSYGVKIDGVGLQGHLVSEPTGTQSVVTPSIAVLTKTLQDLADLNVDVAYTELDIRRKTPVTTAKQADAAAAWARVAQSCINVSRCVGMTLWGVRDSYSWVPGTFSGEGNALLWNDSFQKKSSYESFISVLNGKNVTKH